MLPISVAQVASRASALVMVLLLASCGGGDNGDDTRPTTSPTRTPTATLPSLEVPSPTRSPDRTESVEAPSPTRSPGRTDTPDEPETQPPPTSEPPTEEPAPETPAPTAQEETSTPGTASDEPVPEPVDDDSAPTWVWWLLGAVVVGSIGGIPVALRARRRSAWHQELAMQEGELAWFARELLPELRRAGSREQVSGGWAVGQARVSAAEDRLTVLESTAPGQADRQRTRSLRDMFVTLASTWSGSPVRNRPVRGRWTSTRSSPTSRWHCGRPRPRHRSSGPSEHGRHEHDRHAAASRWRAITTRWIWLVPS